MVTIEPKRLGEAQLAELGDWAELLKSTRTGKVLNGLLGHIAALDAELAAANVELAKPCLMRITNRQKRPDLVISDD